MISLTTNINHATERFINILTDSASCMVCRKIKSAKKSNVQFNNLRIIIQ